MLTSSHNPAEYLGVKLRMADGRREPRRVHRSRGSPCCRRSRRTSSAPSQTADLMTDYLAALRELVDVEAIRGANLRVVCDPLYGAGRHYLADPSARHGRGSRGNPQRGGPHPLPGCIPSPFSPGSMKASRKWASWATMPCSSNDGDAGPHCRWRLARQLRERPPHHHAAYQAHGRPRARTGRVVSHGDGVGYARPHVPQAGAGARQYARRLQVDLRRDGKGRRP